MIQQATRDHTGEIVQLLKEFLQDTAYSQAPSVGNNYRHLCRLVWAVLDSGYIWIARQDAQPVGLLMAQVMPNMWAPNLIEMRELVFFVKPSARNSLVGGRLFSQFCQQAEQLKSQNKINVIFTTKMSSTSGYDLEKRGFRHVETTFIKE